MITYSHLSFVSCDSFKRFECHLGREERRKGVPGCHCRKMQRAVGVEVLVFSSNWRRLSRTFCGLSFYQNSQLVPTSISHSKTPSPLDGFCIIDKHAGPNVKALLVATKSLLVIYNHFYSYGAISPHFLFSEIFLKESLNTLTSSSSRAPLPIRQLASSAMKNWVWSIWVEVGVNWKFWLADWLQRWRELRWRSEGNNSAYTTTVPSSVQQRNRVHLFLFHLFPRLHPPDFGGQTKNGCNRKLIVLSR